MLAGMWSPNSASAIRWASTCSAASARVAALDALQRVVGEPGSTTLSVTIAAVGTSAVLSTATVCPGRATARFAASAAPTRSIPISTSAVPRDARRIPSIGCSATRTSETTGPPFCASPTCSSPAANEPSRCAAICRICDAVTTPVPPMPGIRISVLLAVEPRTGSASATGSAGISRRAHPCPARPAGTTGSRPSGSYRSELQDAWWMRVLRPNSVATGCTDRQVETCPRSRRSPRTPAR